MEEHLNQAIKEHLELSTLEISGLKEKVIIKEQIDNITRLMHCRDTHKRSLTFRAKAFVALKQEVCINTIH